MQIFPSPEQFESRYKSGKAQLVWTRRVADLETPVSASLKLMKENEPFFLLESVEGGETRGRYSIIGMQPDLLWRCKGNAAEQCTAALSATPVFTPCEGDALSSLRALTDAMRVDIPEELPPMSAGLIGYLGYDMVKLMERLPDTKPDVLGIPDACLMRPQVMVIFDSVADVLYVVTIVRPEPGKSLDSAFTQASDRIREVCAALDRQLDSRHLARNEESAALRFSSNTSRSQYHAMVEKAKEYIRAGDIFQVVPSQRFTAPFTLHPFAFYRALRHLNPSPFLFYLSFGSFVLTGSSPEILVRLRDNTVTIRPIAGTRKRGKNRQEDEELARDLLSDPKELAEHLMLLDLGRNDVGRVAKPGTVRVTEKMVIEHYSHVMHIVSNVEGEINPSFGALDALKAGFPAGTVSGAPKIRAMEIIDELEPVRRSFYGGCIGYFSANGSMDTCIALRTALIKDKQIHVQAGGGVVADSDPEAEYQESCNKAKALMRAAEMAGDF